MILAGIASLALAALSAPAVPAAIATDPPVDRSHPASGSGIQFLSHGERVNAQLYLPAGAGPKPAVILLHGLPGNEQNLDLARAMQRAGWGVITFHYRGSWGSGGKFTLEGGCDDVDALLAEIESPQGAGKWHVDPKRIVIIGHSYGGYVAACASARHPELIATGLIAPWDISFDARAFAKLSPAAAQKLASEAFNDVDGRLSGADAQSLMAAIRDHGAKLDLAATAPALARRPLLLATATRDDPDDQAADLRGALGRLPNARVTYRLFETDHGFNDQRIALETFILDWLAPLPGAPPQR
jgi:pimeloyl-ACP methyl ester carboxylesterase